MFKTTEASGEGAPGRQSRVSSHLHEALELCEDDGARYHLREALQIVRCDEF